MVQKTLRVKEVFFDFEGTLVDFQWQLVPAVEECLSALVKSGFKQEWYGTDPNYATIFNHTLELVQKGWKEDPGIAEIIGGIYDRYDADALTRWNRNPQTLEILERLREMGFRMGIISNIGDKALRAALDQLDLTGRVGVVISRNDVRRLKPDPEGLIKAAENLKIDSTQCLFIGDSRKDVKAAREAGMSAGYIMGGEDSPKAIAEYPADIEIESLDQLPPLLSRITS
jgi:HAD superfamily hydrolase (TIGR01549 family)